MTQACLVHHGLEEFAAREPFIHLVSELLSAPVLGMEHGAVEALLSREGAELLRRKAEGALTPVVGSSIESTAVGCRHPLPDGVGQG